MRDLKDISLLCVLFVLTTLLGGCMESAVKNGDFNDWCGDELCLWETNEGTIEKVSTWHKDDYGVSFTGDPTIISQRIDSFDTKCYLFTIHADVAADAALYFEMDYLEDDLRHPEFSQKVEAPDWNKVKIDVAVPSWCDAFRLILRKTGQGTVVVASIVDVQYEVCPISVPDDQRPPDMECESDDDCRSGVCSPPDETTDAGSAGGVCQ